MTLNQFTLSLLSIDLAKLSICSVSIFYITYIHIYIYIYLFFVLKILPFGHFSSAIDMLLCIGA